MGKVWLIIHQSRKCREEMSRVDNESTMRNEDITGYP